MLREKLLFPPQKLGVRLPPDSDGVGFRLGNQALLHSLIWYGTHRHSQRPKGFVLHVKILQLIRIQGFPSKYITRFNYFA